MGADSQGLWCRGIRILIIIHQTCILFSFQKHPDADFGCHLCKVFLIMLPASLLNLRCVCLSDVYYGILRLQRATPDIRLRGWSTTPRRRMGKWRYCSTHQLTNTYPHILYKCSHNPPEWDNYFYSRCNPYTWILDTNLYPRWRTSGSSDHHKCPPPSVLCRILYNHKQ
jgi:hypothetical protein